MSYGLISAECMCFSRFRKILEQLNIQSNTSRNSGFDMKISALILVKVQTRIADPYCLYLLSNTFGRSKTGFYFKRHKNYMIE